MASGAAKGWQRFLVGAVLVLTLVSLPFALGRPMERSSSSRWSGSSGKSVALINLSGTIQTITDNVIGDEMGVGPVIDALASARKDSRVAAVVLRINSPGGSAAASQEVHRAVLKVREAQKPVVISMADVAASGGYYVAVGGDRILANPSTITGSIGVLSQFLNLSELAEKYGVRLETVKTGPYKDIGNPTEPFTEAEREVMQRLVDDSLEQFIMAIAQGRNMDVEEVRRLADGRVFTGNQAKELGLIDDFGDLEDAIQLAGELAGIEGEPHVIEYARPRRNLLRLLRSMAVELFGSGEALALEKYFLRVLHGDRPALTIQY